MTSFIRRKTLDQPVEQQTSSVSPIDNIQQQHPKSEPLKPVFESIEDTKRYKLHNKNSNTTNQTTSRPIPPPTAGLNKQQNPQSYNKEQRTSALKKVGESSRKVLNRVETAPSEGWKLLKKWVTRQSQSKSTRQQVAINSLVRQAEVNALGPLLLSMFIAKDEDGKNRIPVFLNNMTVRITKYQEEDDPFPKLLPRKNRKEHRQRKRFRGTIFKITVTYGTGDNKIIWSVYRKYWDFVKLHYKYKKKYSKISAKKEANMIGVGLPGKSKLPNFPSLPRHHFRKFNKKKDMLNQQQTESSFTSANSSSIPQQQQQQTRQLMQQRQVSVMDEEALMRLVRENNTADDISDHAPITMPKFQMHDTDSQSISSSRGVDIIKADSAVLQAMESYLNQFIASLDPYGHINRLCKFLEISALGIHLAAKYPNASYYGKEGYLMFQSRTDRDPKQTRKFLQDGLICSLPTTGGRRRRKPKWFLVCESYMVCVDDPSDCGIYDVFLFDQGFDIHRLALFGDKSSHHVHKSKKKLSNALANASHWASGKSTLCLKNIQGVYHFRAKNEEQAKQFEHSVRVMASKSIWIQENRFNSFAPIRENVPVAWFVDGRDYFWDISVALENAKESIYIHDWWLSPELFLRRPAAQNLEWRLDRILRRKADQGVKIYIVMYKEVAMALPLFSHMAKRHLLSLSSNIFVQRHPSRALDIFNKNSIFFWAHHEKICVIDNQIAFIGGLDQCFGRYDTPSHALTDDHQPELDLNNQNPQIWPGKDFSNPRIIDFHTLDKPFEDNMDRSALPRMPWHDISMRIVGQAARDVSRHFIQRWNFLRRKKPSAPKRPTPMLLPVPDDQITALGVDDPRICHPHSTLNANVQILRSVSPWSIGSADRTEHSIQTAYCESIRDSEHLIYIENQFFVTSTKSGNTVIENKIGDAIVQRIIKASKEKKRWRAIIIVPLVPGFPANFDETEASTVRLIMQCQYLSIARGPDSLIGRLHNAGVVNTHEYINFYGLRNWGELNGQFITEQVYIHAKTMIVDDKLVIIGSANINERSQLGTRDSEIAACIQDTKDLMESTFNGKKVLVGRFAHTLRMRLMCEHIGLDTDFIDVERYTNSKKKSAYMKQPLWENYHSSRFKADHEKVACIPPFIQVSTDEASKKKEQEKIKTEEMNEGPIPEDSTTHRVNSDSSDTESENSGKIRKQKRGIKHGLKQKLRPGVLKSGGTGKISQAEYERQRKEENEEHPSKKAEKKAEERVEKEQPSELATENLSDKSPSLQQTSSNGLQSINTTDTSSSSGGIPVSSPSKSIFNKRKSSKEDYLEFWSTLECDCDNNNDTKYILESKKSVSKEETDTFSQKNRKEDASVPVENYYSSTKLEPLDTKGKTVGDIYNILKDPLTDKFQNFWHLLARINTNLFRHSFLVMPDNNVRNWDQYHNFIKMAKLFLGRTNIKHGGTKNTVAAAAITASPLPQFDEEDASIYEIIKHIRGHLVIWPNQFMEDDDQRNEFLFNVDKIVPLEIFD